MSRKSRKTNRRRIIATAMASIFMLQQTMALTVFAGTITDINGNALSKNGNTWNITADRLNTAKSMGIRTGADFTVDNGEIANLIFSKDGTQFNTFVNLVKNGVNIDGILNTVNGSGNFYNGKAIFISPKGMVVGANGILNVGSLAGYSVSGGTFAGLENFEKQQAGLSYSSGGTLVDVADSDIINGNAVSLTNIAQEGDHYLGDAITINGKIISRGDVDLRASKVDVANTGVIVAGVPTVSATNQVITSSTGAEALFNQLVNTDGLSSMTAGGNSNITIIGEGNYGTSSTPNGGVNIAGKVYNNGTGNTIIRNYDNEPGQGMTVSGTVENRNGALDFRNNKGAMVFTADSNVKNLNGATTIYNTPYDFSDDRNSKMQLAGNITTNGTLTVDNLGVGGMEVSKGGKIIHNGNAYFYNGRMADGTPTNAYEKNATNGTGAMDIAGEIYIRGNGSEAKFENTDYGYGGLNVRNGAKIDHQEGAKTEFINAGHNGFNVGTPADGTTEAYAIVNSGANAMDITNTGAYGLNIESHGQVTGSADITMTNTSENSHTNTYTDVLGQSQTVTGGLNVQGVVNTTGNITMTSNDANILIGDDRLQGPYISSGKNIVMTANDASILNYGVDKTLISAQNTSSSYGNLTMTANNGTIGLEVQETACTGANCTGVGPKTTGARDFKKSINAIVKNKVKATTTDSSAAKNTDYVINYASIDSDMNIDTIKADGRVILTVDNSGHAWGGEATAAANSGKRYDMLNARSTNSDTNVEGWGMSLIANGSIGSKNKPVTFIQNKAETNRMFT